MTTKQEEAIRKMASAYGFQNVSKFDESRYDSSTGTLYCNGYIIPYNSIQKAREYFKQQMGYYKELTDKNGSQFKDMLYCNTVAYNAINMLLSKLD